MLGGGGASNPQPVLEIAWLFSCEERLQGCRRETRLADRSQEADRAACFRQSRSRSLSARTNLSTAATSCRASLFACWTCSIAASGRGAAERGRIQKSNWSMLSLVKRYGWPSRMLSPLISTEPSRPAVRLVAPGFNVPSLQGARRPGRSGSRGPWCSRGRRSR